MFTQVLEQLIKGEDLSPTEITAAMNDIMSGNATDAQIGAFLMGLRIKGETPAEVAAAAGVMRKHATLVDAGARSVIDTCGTGGDGAGTFNISTTTAFVAAGADICVAKHGNRAVTSKCGSADVLAALGFNLAADPMVMEECIQENGIGFLFAPNMHPAMKYVMPARKQMKIRTIFNMLGPLTNPAAATGQVLGVFAPELTEVFAEALRDLGCRRAYVVHGEDGLDEITCTGNTRVSELRDGNIRTYDLAPELFIGETFDSEEMAGGDPEENAKILRGILDGSVQGAPRAVVLLNAAAAIVVGEKADTLDEGLKLAAASIDSGAALAKLETLVKESQVA
ncbi:MAG: anthranilate phosphoribosyltransferase [Victivallales bacterium]|jgi:anthranilate phosphoribosyltransferase|nr:anthranilate phosphoribosyltransferase [Victivallales bacterium]